MYLLCLVLPFSAEGVASLTPLSLNPTPLQRADIFSRSEYRGIYYHSNAPLLFLFQNVAELTTI